MTGFDSSTPPPNTGSHEDARRLAEWDFLRKTPEQRLQWLIDILAVGYASGAFSSVQQLRSRKESPP
jgi:hypothetical protein